MLAKRHEGRYYPGSRSLLLRLRTLVNRQNSAIARFAARTSARTDRVRYRTNSNGKRALLLLAGGALLSLACSGCGSGPGVPASHPATSPAGSNPATAGSSPARTSGTSAAPASGQASCPAQVFARMSEAQRVGQLFLVGIAGAPAAYVAQAVRTYHFGSLLWQGTSTTGVAADRQASQAIQALASSATTAGVRFFVAANQEGGQVQELKGPGFTVIPPALTQGQLSAAELQRQAAAWGRELRSAGVNLDLAPVMDVVPAATASQNAPIGALQREFGHTPQVTGSHGVAFIRGMKQAGVTTTAKHFPGLGQVVGNTDFTSEVVDTTTGPNSPYLKSFQTAIKAGVPFVMVALATYTRIDPHHLAAFSSRVIGGLLRQQLHFKGVVVSDDLGVAAAVAGLSPANRGIDFLTAGGDLITSQSLPAAIAMDRAVLARAADDASFRATVNSAVMHILDAKQAAHLMTCH
jgi:beta-N-acetylhexosaminidase